MTKAYCICCLELYEKKDLKKSTFEDGEGIHTCFVCEDCSDPSNYEQEFPIC